MLLSNQAVSKCTTAHPTSAKGKARFENPNTLFGFAFCNFQQSSAQQLIIEKQATSGEQEHHLCEALLPPRLSNLHHNWGGRLASEHWVVNLLKLLKRFTTSPTPSPSTGASRRECSSTQCLERWWLRYICHKKIGHLDRDCRLFKVLTPLVLLYSSLELRSTIKRLLRDKFCD